MKRQVRPVEIVIGAGIHHDPRQRAAPAGAVDHLAAGRWRTDIILGADQKQRRHPRAPAKARGDPAIRIERDGRAEIRLEIARGELRAHRPQQRAGAVRPSQQADAIMGGPGLPHQPLPGCHDVHHALAAGKHMMLLDPALRPEFARTVTVRQQHRIACLQQLLGPVPVAGKHRLGTAGQPAATMQRDHHRERPVALGLVELRMQDGVARGNVDLTRQWQRRRLRGESHGPRNQECNG